MTDVTQILRATLMASLRRTHARDCACVVPVQRGGIYCDCGVTEHNARIERVLYETTPGRRQGARHIAILLTVNEHGTPTAIVGLDDEQTQYTPPPQWAFDAVADLDALFAAPGDSMPELGVDADQRPEGFRLVPADPAETE